jgi:hypothetical protein
VSDNVFALSAAAIVPSLVLAQRGEFVAAETHARAAIALADDNGLMHLLVVDTAVRTART